MAPMLLAPPFPASDHMDEPVFPPLDAGIVFGTIEWAEAAAEDRSRVFHFFFRKIDPPETEFVLLGSGKIQAEVPSPPEKDKILPAGIGGAEP